MNEDEMIQQPRGADVAVQRPAYVPEKFWDMNTQSPNVEALARSYQELERKVSATPVLNVPGSPDDYCVSCKSNLFENNPMVNQRLHQAGFSQDQVQLVYDLAHEALEPLVGEIVTILNTMQLEDRLEEKFGGPERWHEVSRQLLVWGRNKLPEHTFEAMASSYEGVIALYDMMNKNEPSFKGQGAVAPGLNSEADIRKLMRDPKYWRDQDPTTVERVREGFRRLYPD